VNDVIHPARDLGAREGYDLWANDYDALDNPLVAMATRARASLTATIAGAHARVLELGCGTGRNRDFLLDAGAREYVGVDDSEGMLRCARARPADPRCRWITADITRALPDDLRDFDVVLFCLVLEHTRDLAPILARAAKAARAGARLQIYELHAALRAEGTRAHFRAGDREHLLPSYPHDALDYRRALADSGWELTAISEWTATPDACRASAKLAKYLGKPVLIDVSARRSDEATPR
jgi:malonyl-CoA O-methyltransferase